MKLNRREILHYATLLTALSLSPGTALVETLAGSKANPRNKIDIHHHIIPEFYLKALAAIGMSSTNGAVFPYWTPQKTIEAMGLNGMRKDVISFSAPGIFFWRY